MILNLETQGNGYLMLAFDIVYSKWIKTYRMAMLSNRMFNCIKFYVGIDWGIKSAVISFHENFRKKSFIKHSNINMIFIFL